MRPVLSILLITIILLPSLGYYFIFHCSQNSIRKEIKRKIKKGLSKEELIYFSFSKLDAKKLDWKNKNDFKYLGKMYDIVQADTTKDSIHYKVIWDSKESKLYADIEHKISEFFKSNPLKKSEQKLYAEFSKNLFFEEYLCMKILDTHSYINSKYIKDIVDEKFKIQHIKYREPKPPQFSFV